jgi:linoleoyl-CoA desaturase
MPTGTRARVPPIGPAPVAAPPVVRFAPASASPFAVEVRREVAQSFRERGVSIHANAAMHARTAAMLAMLIGPYLVLVLAAPTGVPALLLCIAVGVGLAGLGFAPCHDALHGAYASRRWINHGLGYLFEAMGANARLWRLGHNRVHHTFTNLHDMDDDLDGSPLIRISPRRPRRRYHRWQAWYALPLYAFATLNWILLKDYRTYFRRRIGALENPRPTVRGFLGLLPGKLVHYGWTIAIPLLVLQPSAGAFLAGFLAMHATAGLLLGVTFQLAHAVDDVEFPDPEVRTLQDSWMVHQMRTTANFARSNRLLTWYVGGLNYQVEHHLFPNVCSVHYPRIAPIVAACAARHGVPYHDRPTIRAALAAHWRLLIRHGRPSPAPPGGLAGNGTPAAASG